MHAFAGESDGKMGGLFRKPEFLSSLVQGHACLGKEHRVERQRADPGGASALSGSFWV